MAESSARAARSDGAGVARSNQGLLGWLRSLRRGRGADAALRDALEELIEEHEGEGEEQVAIGADERTLLINILKLRKLTASDIMVPRADIVAVPNDMGLDDLVKLMGRDGHSRLPVYRETLDDVVGMVHIKDVLLCATGERPFDLAALVRQVLFVAPSMRVLDLLLQMRLSHAHMALVVDEFGGIDGLLTIEDVVEEIVGEIEDEHDVEEGPRLLVRPDGSVLADGRATIEEFEELVGPVLTEEEREADVNTLAGLVFALIGRVPSRGELVTHPSGMAFEVVEADPRTIKRLKIRNVPRQPAATAAGG
jgi:CBS domain containing-hemolysin-like protein